MKKFLGLKGEALNWAIGVIAGCDFLLFGYGAYPESTMSSLANVQFQTKVSWAVS